MTIPIRKFGIFLLLAGLIFSQFDCSNESFADELDGEQLAKAHCQGCHIFPEAELLDRSTWENYVLPRMGYFYGIYDKENPRARLIEAGVAGRIVDQANIFPKEKTMDSNVWEKIRAYYLDHAPVSLSGLDTTTIRVDSSRFTLKVPPYKLSPPSTTFIDIVPEDQSIRMGDANSRGYYEFDPVLEMQKAAQVRESVVHQIETPSSLVLTIMGQFSPTDAPTGFVMTLPKASGKQPQVIIEQLQRPVHNTMADLNQDGMPDFVICEFGKWMGRLAWWEQLENGTFEPHVLSNQPGAVKSVVEDFNKDGYPDVLALFGQGREGFFVYYNQGDGTFEEEVLMAFPPSYGSSSFDWIDINKDGHADILYTAGDNADYNPVYKPYHGIYVFLNQGDFTFEKQFFYHLNGAYRAMARDFDQDGDGDLAVISFFPDFGSRPQESFLYLENQGSDRFVPFTFPQVNVGRWVVMDAGDLDGDGDEDIALGSLTMEVIPKLGFVDQWVQQGIPFVVLENNLR